MADRGEPFDVQVRTVHRERWRRVLILTGDVDATVIYNGIGNGERVYVNGQLRAQTSMWGWRTVQPRVEFLLPGTGNTEVPARIDVVATLWPPWRFGIWLFRFSVGGDLLYDELDGHIGFGCEPGFVTDEPFEEDY